MEDYIFLFVVLFAEILILFFDDDLSRMWRKLRHHSKQNEKQQSDNKLQLEFKFPLKKMAIVFVLLFGFYFLVYPTLKTWFIKEHEQIVDVVELKEENNELFLMLSDGKILKLDLNRKQDINAESVTIQVGDKAIEYDNEIDAFGF